VGGLSAVQRLRILVVDDSSEMRVLLRRMLRHFGVDPVADAPDGELALQWITINDGKVDVVICDWNMPGMSGMDLFRKIRAIHPGILFLMLTGRADVPSVMAAKEAGVTGYLVKPVSLKNLESKMTFLAGLLPAPAY
jgi:two-component system chemotaxis response regulator CheY